MTVDITGEVTTILGALGQGEYDEGGLRLLGLVGPTYEDDAFPGELYRTFPRSGAAGFDAFAVGERFLHVEYSANGKPTMITALVGVPGL